MLFRTRPNRPDLDATKMPTDVDVAWAAGIFEGEGTVRLAGKTKRGFMIQVPQKDPELLYWLRDLFGGSVGKPCGSNPCSTWNICGDRARIFSAQIYSYLTSRRKQQIDGTRGLDFLKGASPEGLSVAELHVRMVAFYEEHLATNWNGPNTNAIRKARYAARKKEDPNFLAKLNARNKKWREKNIKGNLIEIA
jgi:hypothetical protein